MHECDECGGHVTDRYVRVFFAAGDPVYCRDCTTFDSLCEHATDDG